MALISKFYKLVFGFLDRRPDIFYPPQKAFENFKFFLVWDYFPREFRFPLGMFWDGRIGFGFMSFPRNFSILFCLVFGLDFSLQTHKAWAQAKESTFFQLADWLDKNAIGFSSLDQATRQIGHRLTGTENGRKAEEFVFNLLKNSGIDSVVYEPFEFTAWQRKDCHLEIVPYRSDNYVDFKAVSLANTSSENGIWHIIDVKDGLEREFDQAGEKIKGKCVLVNLGMKDTSNQGKANLHRAEKVSLALKYGAKAVLFVHPGSKSQLLTGTASLTGEIVPIPALCISGPDGQLVRDWMKKEKLMAEMKVNNPVQSGKARDVMAFLPAGKKTKETIVFTAHLDSWDLATGATDNGLGSFTLIDIVRALKPFQKELKRNLVFVWTMGEEQGLLGSKHLVKKWKASKELDHVRLVINLDMVGNPSGFNAFAWPGLEPALQDFHQKARKVMPDFKGNIVNSPGLHSDHQPFLLHGIPSTSGISSMPDSIYDCYHANCDNISLIQPQYLLSSAKLHSMLALQISTLKKLPFHNLPDKKLREWLEKNRLKEKLEISGEWKWK